MGDDEEKQVNNKEIVNPEKKRKNREGYDDTATDKGFIFKEAKASDFIMGKNHIQILNECNSIVIDTPRINKHAKTTAEIRECLKDLKVLGMKELRALKKWKDSLKKEFDELDADKTEEAVPAILQKTKEEEEDEEMAAIDKEVEELRDEERRKARRLKKKELKEKQKRLEKINLKMIIPGDEGPTADDLELFRMSQLSSSVDLKKVSDDAHADMVAQESDEEDEEAPRPKHEKYNKEDGTLDGEGLWYNGDANGKDSGDEDESDADSDDEEEELGLEEEELASGGEEEIMEQDKETENPLIQSLSNEDVGEKKARKAEMWFQKTGLLDLEEDEQLEEEEIGRAVDIVKKKGGSIRQKEEQDEDQGSMEGESESEDEVGNRHHENTLADSGMSSDSEDEDEEEVEHKSASGKVYNKDGFEIVPQQKIKRRANLSPEELALGEKLVRSKKVGEAKARRKRKVARKLDQAKKKSAAILESEDTGSREKAKEIKALYRKAHMAGKPKEVSYVVARKHKAEKRSQRPSGIKGPYKQVDPRMKKDTSTKRSNVKKGKKRRLKGKQAKPTKQFNTNR